MHVKTSATFEDIFINVLEICLWINSHVLLFKQPQSRNIPSGSSFKTWNKHSLFFIPTPPFPHCCQQLRISEGKLGWNSGRDICADNYCIIFLQRLSSSDSSNATQMAQPHNKSFASISHLVCKMVSHHWKPCSVTARYEEGINLYSSVYHLNGDLIHKLLIWGSFESKLKHIEPWNIDSLQWWCFKDFWLAHKRSSKDLFDLLSVRENSIWPRFSGWNLRSYFIIPL